MDEIVFQVERDESGMLIAYWDAPEGGGIATQGCDLRELQEQVKDVGEAVAIIRILHHAQ